MSALLATSVAAPARAECTRDIECKGDRICEDGRCVPPATPPATTPDALPPAFEELPSPCDRGVPCVRSLPGDTHPGESSWNGGFEGSLWLGYATAMGTLTASDPVNVWGTFFLGGDAGGRIGRRWYVGAYGVSAFPFTNGCPVGRTCLELDLAVGGVVAYHWRDLRDRGGWDPSLALGVGYEIMEASATYAGLQYKVQLNVDYLSLHHEVSSRPADALGLFLALAAGAGDLTASGDTGSPWHAWLSLGLRVTWDAGR